MTARGTVRRRVTQVLTTAETGFSLLEVVVAMTIMSVVMAAFTTGILQMYRVANRTESESIAQSQLTIAFERLDKEIRYASAISDPDPTRSYVEYVTMKDDKPTCTELRISDRQLQWRNWQKDMTPGAWALLASNVTSGEFQKHADTPTFQQLKVVLEVSAGSGATAATVSTDVTFTALNSSSADQTGTVCTAGRSV